MSKLKKLISIMLAVPAFVFAIWVNPATWYLSALGLTVLSMICIWNIKENYE